MQKLGNTDFYIFTEQQAEALRGGIMNDLKAPAPLVPSGCGPMMQVRDEDDRLFLEQALP